jgi:uncharacterized protein YbjT (DUF2867 family)
MTERKTILVTGATGAQGGGVARHLLSRGKFAVRCLTRNPASEKAAALKKAGAEVVQGDFDNTSSLLAALRGCHGVFGMTSFWEHFDKEYEQGKNLVDAVATSNVEHFVFSVLPSAKKLSGGKIEVPHLEMKAELEEYTRRLGPPTTFVSIAFYFENFLTFFPPQKQGNGNYAFGFPQGDTPLAGVAVEDTGGVVSAIFERPAVFKGKTVGIVGDDLPPAKYAEIMTEVLGNKIVYNYIPRDAYAALGFPGAQELADMFEFTRLYVPNRSADVKQSRALYPQMQDFGAWLKANKGKFQGILQG